MPLRPPHGRITAEGESIDHGHIPRVGEAVLVTLVASGCLQLCGGFEHGIAGALCVDARKVEQVRGHAQLCQVPQWSTQLLLPVHCQLHPAHSKDATNALGLP